MPGMPFNATVMAHFRKLIGVKAFNLIFKMSVALHGKQAQESSVLIDTKFKKQLNQKTPLPTIQIFNKTILT